MFKYILFPRQNVSWSNPIISWNKTHINISMYNVNSICNICNCIHSDKLYLSNCTVLKEKKFLTF